MSKTGFSSPMSFVGSTRRAIAWATKHDTPAMKIAAWTGVLLWLPLFWTFLALWYLVAFGVFGIITVPVRFFRRSQRKSLALQQQQTELMRQMVEQKK